MPTPNAPPNDGPQDEIDPKSSRNRIFYGWWIVIGGMAVLMFSGGLGFFGPALILDPLRAQFGWSKGAISSAVTFLLITAALVGPFIGEQVDRHGSTRVLLFGSCMICLGFVLLSRISELWQLYAVYLYKNVIHGICP